MTALMLVEAAMFAVAAVVHSGRVVAGFAHRRARIAETVIGLVLLAGALLSWVLPAQAGSVQLAAQGFALAGTTIGLFTVIVGVGPRTVPDVLYHVAMLAVLAAGLYRMLPA